MCATGAQADNPAGSGAPLLHLGDASGNHQGVGRGCCRHRVQYLREGLARDQLGRELALDLNRVVVPQLVGCGDLAHRDRTVRFACVLVRQARLHGGARAAGQCDRACEQQGRSTQPAESFHSCSLVVVELSTA